MPLFCSTLYPPRSFFVIFFELWHLVRKCNKTSSMEKETNKIEKLKIKKNRPQFIFASYLLRYRYVG